MNAPSLHPRVRLACEALVAAAGLTLLLWAWRADRHWFELHSFRDFCAYDPAQLGRVTAWRWAAVLAGVLVLVVIRPWLGRWAGRRSARDLAGLCGRTGLAVVLALVMCELVLRRSPYHPPSVLHREYEAIPQPDPRYGWSPVPSQVTELTVGDTHPRFVIDAGGYRVRSLDDAVDPSRPTVLVAGESIASGFAIDYGETFGAMVADALGVQVANVGVQAYAMDIAYLRLHDVLPRFEHPLATVTTVVPTALDRNSDTERPHVLFEPSGGFHLEPRRDGTWLGRSQLVSVFDRVIGLHSDEALQRARAAIVATRRDSDARGVPAIFVLINWPNCLPDDTGAPSIERTVFGGLDVIHVGATLPPETWDPITWHPRGSGNRIIADAVLEALRAAHVDRAR
jgi:hypothetical protein